jgi:cell division protein FtsA
MTGTRLEANVHIITASSTATQNIVSCVNRAGMEVTETVLEQLAAAEAVISLDEKELGVALADIGGGTPDLAIFDKCAIWHTSVLSIGGDHFTNDVAVGLRTPILEAEKIKKKYGCALGTMVSEEDTMEVPSVGGRHPRILSRQYLAEIIQPRAEEICHLLYEEIQKTGYERVLNSGVVFTGGSAALEGLPDVAERIFDMPIRCGVPCGVGGLVDVAASPSYATGVGLVLYAHRSRSNRLMPRRRFGSGPLTRIWDRCRRLVS